MKQYLEQSARTAATTAHFDNVATVDAVWAFNDFIDAAKQVDDIKKSIFYNRTFSGDSEDSDYVGPRLTDVASMDLIHGILGVASESAELVELLTNPGFNRPVDLRKIVDESGDILWYLALIFRAAGVTFEEVAAKNLQKLMVRFPEKFEESLANHRDDDKERAVFSA